MYLFCFFNLSYMFITWLRRAYSRQVLALGTESWRTRQAAEGHCYLWSKDKGLFTPILHTYAIPCAGLIYLLFFILTAVAPYRLWQSNLSPQKRPREFWITCSSLPSFWTWPAIGPSSSGPQSISPVASATDSSDSDWEEKRRQAVGDENSF